MGRFIIFMFFGLAGFFGLVATNLNKHQVDSAEKVTEHLTYNQARNLAASGVNVAMSKISFNNEWKEGYSTTHMNGASGSVVVEEVNMMMRRIISTGTYEEVTVVDTVTIGIPPDLADLAAYTTKEIDNVTVGDDISGSFVEDTDLLLENVGFMIPFDFDALTAIAVAQGHVYNGNFTPGKNYPNSSFYHSYPIPNVTVVNGNLHLKGGRDVYGIFLVNRTAGYDTTVTVDGSARLHGVITLPDPMSIVMHGGGDPKEASIEGGIFINGSANGTGNHIKINYDQEFMTVFSQWQLQKQMYVINWLETPPI